MPLQMVYERVWITEKDVEQSYCVFNVQGVCFSFSTDKRQPQRSARRSTSVASYAPSRVCLKAEEGS